MVRRFEYEHDNRAASACISKPGSDVVVHPQEHQYTVPFHPGMPVAPASLPWPNVMIGGDDRPFEPADADRHPAIAALDAAVPAGCSLGFADPFHSDWPHW